MGRVYFRKVDVDGFNIFYREGGAKDAQALLLLHGFPTASHMFRDLIPQLLDRFYVIAPDLPGFGQSDMPDRDKFNYTFDNIARIIDRFTRSLSSSASRSTPSTTAPRPASGWQHGTRNASRPSSRKIGTPMRRG